MLGAPVHSARSDIKCSRNSTVAAPLIEQSTHPFFELVAERVHVDIQMCKGFGFQIGGDELLPWTWAAARQQQQRAA